MEETNSVNKKLIGNEKRLQAENAKRLAQKANIATVQQALKNIDGGVSGPNKKIVFRDESDEEVHTELRTKQDKTANQLFSNSSDEENEINEDEPSFHFREQFEGEKGQKLFALQSKFNNDSRFRIDSRFVDTQTKSSREFAASSIEEETKIPETDRETDATNKNEQPKDGENKYYFAISQNLTSLFANSADKPKFSQFSKSVSDDSVDEDNDSYVKVNQERSSFEDVIPRKKSRRNSESQAGTISAPVNPFKPSGWFFVKPDDKCLKEGCLFFCRKDTEEDLRAKWSAFRPSVLEGFKKLKKGHGKTANKWKNPSKNKH